MCVSNWTTPCSQVNYENPDVNISLPVFTIHGNHDDPSGENNYAAVDIMSSVDLINYFGKKVAIFCCTCCMSCAAYVQSKPNSPRQYLSGPKCGMLSCRV